MAVCELPPECAAFSFFEHRELSYDDDVDDKTPQQPDAIRGGVRSSHTLARPFASYKCPSRRPHFLHFSLAEDLKASLCLHFPILVAISPSLSVLGQEIGFTSF